MATSALNRLPIVPRPEIRVVPDVKVPTRTWGVRDLPVGPAANSDIVEGFASKFLRIGGKILGRALFYAQFLEFEGDTAHHSPIIDQPPKGKTVTQWLSEMEEATRVAIDIATKRAEILRHTQNHDGHLARRAQQELTQLLAYAQAIQQGLGAPITSGALAMVASAGGGDSSGSFSGAVPDKKLPPVDWKQLAASGDSNRYVAVAKKRIQEVSGVVSAAIDAGTPPSDALQWYVDEAQPELTAIYESARDLPIADEVGETWHNTRNTLTYYIPYGQMVLEDGNVEEIREFFAPPKAGLVDIVAKTIDRHKAKATFEVRGLEGIQISPTANPDDWTELLDNLVRNAADNPKPGQKTHILIQYGKGVLTVEDSGKGMSPRLLTAFLAGKRTHSGVVLEGDAANADENVGHGYGGRLIQKWAEKAGAKVDYLSQEGVGTRVALTPLRDPIFAPDPLAFVIRGQGNSDQFQYLLERMPANKRVEILRKLSSIMLVVANDMFPKIQVALDKDARKPGEPVPDLKVLKNEMSGIVQRYLRFFALATADTTMFPYESVVESCRRSAQILLDLFRATAPVTAIASSVEWNTETAQRFLLGAVDKMIQGIRRDVSRCIDQEMYYPEILEWYEREVQPQLVHLQAILDTLQGTDITTPLIWDVQRQLSILQTAIPMYLTAGQVNTTRAVIAPAANNLNTMLDAIQARYGDRVQVTKIDTLGVRVAAGVDREKLAVILDDMVGSAAAHPRQKGEAVNITIDMSKGVLVFESDDTQDEYDESWEKVWQLSHDLDIHVENDRLRGGAVATLVFPDGFLEPDPVQFVLAGHYDVGVAQMIVDAMTPQQRMAMLKELEAIATKIEDQAYSQGLDAWGNPDAPRLYLEELQHAAERFGVLAGILLEDLPQQDMIGRGVHYMVQELKTKVRRPEDLF